MIDYQKSLDRVAALTLCEFPEADQAHILTVIDALKKQTPKQVREDKIFGDDGLHYCPTCGVRFIRWGFKHCGECGQALKWD